MDVFGEVRDGLVMVIGMEDLLKMMRESSSVEERKSITTSFVTGIKVVDLLVLVGCG